MQRKIPISQFNQNISKYFKQVVKGEVLYLTNRGIPQIVLISKKHMDLLMNKLLENTWKPSKKDK